MKHKTWFTLMSILVLASFVLTACGAPATPTAAPPAAAPTTAPQAQPTAVPPTTPPQPTEPPTAAPAAFTPLSVSAPDCNYGSADIPAQIKSIEAVDQYTVKFTLCSSDPAFPSKVAFAAFSITSKAYLDANGGDSVTMSEQPNGTGPYMLKEWVRGDHITFEANPNYWGTPPKDQTVIFRWSDQAAQRLLELQSGTVDGIDNPSTEDFAAIEADPNLTLYPRAANNIFYLGMTNTIKPFDDVKVRQAVAMAINKQRIVDSFYPGGSTVADQFLPPFILPGYTEGLKWYDYDPTAAKALLAEAGFPNGFSTTISYRMVDRGYLPSPDKVTQEIQAELAVIGIKAKIVEEESAAFITNTSDGKEPLYLLGWTGDYPDSTNYLDMHFANSNNKQFGTLFPDLVNEIKTASTLSDAAARQQHYDKANELIKQYVPMVPVAHGGSADVFKSTVEGAHSSPLGDEYFAVMNQPGGQLVWMQSGEPAALWCSDETDGETLRACIQMYDALLSFSIGGTEVQPGLAETWSSNTDLTEWTFNLRKNVKFFNGDILNANDVVATFASQWDAKSPNHKGRTGTFEYFGAFFGAMLNTQ
ncbi:MAG: ABC transporter substrate-binding protein [Chloroflexi bacterium]|nr:ABC transporter substrate-binding protein [Chloroflexota bacterium]